MIEAPLPQNEAERMRSLHGMHLLETPIEERFERITRLAQHILGVPISAFTLLDDTRQWFKSVQGLDVSEISRSISLCSHVILGDDIMTVPDTRQDIRFQDSPLVTGNPHVSFYAGCPVRSPDGFNIGVICAIDTQPRQLTAEQVQCLRDLAAILEHELRTANLSHAYRELVTELDTAKRLALIDPLTRIWNRDGIHEILHREASHALPAEEPLSIVRGTVDQFKRIYDRYGPAAGDEVLRTVARKLLSSVGAEDAVGRVGGEEFMIVVKGCPPAELKEKIERIRHRIAEAPMLTDAGMLGISMSFGAASMDAQFPISVEGLVNHANHALHTARYEGGNRVEIAA